MSNDALTSFDGMSGAEMIAAERARQVSLNGEQWSDEHDDEHDTGELAIAGAIYALNSCGEATFYDNPDIRSPQGWPWTGDDWKPKTPIRDLVRAGALMAAEIDRRLRAGEKP